MAASKIALALVVLVGLVAPAGAAKPFPISFGGPFSLIDHNGAARTDRDFRGRFLLVLFGYAHCPDICPTGLQRMADALDLLGRDGARVQPIFITVDPARDTAQVLKSYVAAFHPRLVGLTGSEAQVRAAARAYKVHRRKLRDPDGGDAYLVDHSSITYLMGPDGAFVTLFPHNAEAEFMARAIRRYVRK